MPIRRRVDAPLIRVLRWIVEPLKSIGPFTMVFLPSLFMLTPSSMRQSIMACASSQSGMPVRRVVPWARAAIASCLRAIDLLPGRLTSTSNDLLIAGIKNGFREDNTSPLG